MELGALQEACRSAVRCGCVACLPLSVGALLRTWRMWRRSGVAITTAVRCRSNCVSIRGCGHGIAASATAAATTSASSTTTAYATAATGAKLSCACGRCKITFAAPQNRLTMECACVDCYQHLGWAASQGGPACPQIPRLSYWANDLLEVTGEEHMKVFVLRDGLGSARGQSQRCVATCCHSTLLVDHPAYAGNVCMVFEHACSLSSDALPIDARIYMCDWSESRGKLAASLPQGCPVTDKGPSAAGLSDGRFRNKPFQTAPPEPCRGSTMQQLFSRLPTPTVLGLVEGAACTPTS